MRYAWTENGVVTNIISLNDRGGNVINDKEYSGTLTATEVT